jgi:hypothetical protein
MKQAHFKKKFHQKSLSCPLVLRALFSIGVIFANMVNQYKLIQPTHFRCNNKNSSKINSVINFIWHIAKALS